MADLNDCIEQAVQLYRDMLQAHVHQFDYKAVEKALKQERLAAEQFAVFRQRVEQFSEEVVRRTVVSRDRVLRTLRTMRSCDPDVLQSMPSVPDGAGDVHFFKLKQFTRDDEIENQLAARGLQAANPYAVASVNIDNTDFTRQYKNGTHWQDANRDWCYLVYEVKDGKVVASAFRHRKGLGPIMIAGTPVSPT